MVETPAGAGEAVIKELKVCWSALTIKWENAQAIKSCEKETAGILEPFCQGARTQVGLM